MNLSSLTRVDWFNIWGISAQILGFSILALDLWPEYRKSKRSQMILSFVSFLRFGLEKFDQGDKRAVFLGYVGDKDNIMYASKEIRRQLKRDYPLKMIDDIVQEDQFRLIYNQVIPEYEQWIGNINSKRTYRHMYVGEAIFIVIVGYVLQMTAIFVSAKAWPFSLLAS